MKKFLVVSLLSFFMLTATQVFALTIDYSNGEKLITGSSVNYCAKADRSNVTKITYLGFPTSKLENYGVSYRLYTIEVGYVSTPSLRGIFNGKDIGTLSMNPFKCDSKYNVNASGPFYAGRVVEWYIPASYVQSTNTLTVTMDGKTITTSPKQ